MRFDRRSVALSLPAALLAGCVVGRPMGRPPGVEPEERRYINPGTIVRSELYSQGVRVGTLVVVSAQLPLDPQGDLVGGDDLRAQAARAFANLAAVLRIAGATPADVVRLNLYVVGYAPGDLATIREAAPGFFPHRNPPGLTAVGVTTVGHEGARLAVEATAVLRGLIPRREPAPGEP